MSVLSYTLSERYVQIHILHIILYNNEMEKFGGTTLFCVRLIEPPLLAIGTKYYTSLESGRPICIYAVRR